jgi:putative oxidoreductase
VKKFWLLTVPRVLLGIIFLAGAIDGFSFITTGAHLVHPPTSQRGLQFEEALKSVGFLWPLMKTVELIGAVCLLTNRAPAFGLALLSPIMAVVVLFHGFLNPQGAPLAALLVVCGALLLRAYAPRFARLFESGATTPYADAKEIKT